MKKKELRIGNYLRIKESDTIIQVKQYQLCEYELCKLSEIMLTLEWLKRFGFYYYEDLDEYRSKDNTWFSLITTDMIEGQIDYCWDKPETSSVSIKYVHQLQNLYFALTGEEL